MNKELTREERDKIRRHWRGGGAADYAISSLLDVLDARDARLRGACSKCGQADWGQSGEYPCDECGLPTTHDLSPRGAGERAAREKAEERLATASRALGQALERAQKAESERDELKKQLDRLGDQDTAHAGRAYAAEAERDALRGEAVIVAAREACRTQDTDDFMRLVLALRELDGVDPRAGQSVS